MKRIASFLSSLSIQRITAPCLCLMLVLIGLFLSETVNSHIWNCEFQEAADLLCQYRKS